MNVMEALIELRTLAFLQTLGDAGKRAASLAIEMVDRMCAETIVRNCRQLDSLGTCWAPLSKKTRRCCRDLSTTSEETQEAFTWLEARGFVTFVVGGGVHYIKVKDRFEFALALLGGHIGVDVYTSSDFLARRQA